MGTSPIQSLDCRSAAEKNAVYKRLTDYFCTQVDEKTQRVIVREMVNTYKINPEAHCTQSIMNWSELKKAASDPLCSIGAHTLNHYHLARLPRDEAAFEMAQCVEILAVELGTRPKHFAYPYGGKIAVGWREAELAREVGFVSAVTTRHGLIQRNHAETLHALPRISINGEYQRVHYVKTMLSGVTVPVANHGRRFTTVKSVSDFTRNALNSCFYAFSILSTIP